MQRPVATAIHISPDVHVGCVTLMNGSNKMADNYDWEDDDDDFESESKGSTDVLKELRKANRSKEKQLKELQEQLSKMQSSVRERSVKDVLESRGLNSKIAAFIPKDITSADDVTAWVEEYGDVFGATQADSSEAESSPAQFNPELAALNRISQAQSSGQPFSSDPAQIAAQIASASSIEELNMLLFKNVNGPNVS
jgi:TolA-binding protein